MDTGTTINIISAAGAVAAAVIAWASTRQAEKWSVAQQKLSTHSVAADWLRDIRSWAAEVIDALAEASYASGPAEEGDTDSLETLRSCRHRVSAHIDRGRLLFPNQDVTEFGTEKPSAYRGWRHATLDPLIAAERVMSSKVGSGQYATKELALVEMRRIFVSRVQEILAPDAQNKEVAALIRGANEHRAKDATLGGLLPDASNIPRGAHALLFEGQATGS